MLVPAIKFVTDPERIGVCATLLFPQSNRQSSPRSMLWLKLKQSVSGAAR